MAKLSSGPEGGQIQLVIATPITFKGEVLQLVVLYVKVDNVTLHSIGEAALPAFACG